MRLLGSAMLFAVVNWTPETETTPFTLMLTPTSYVARLTTCCELAQNTPVVAILPNTCCSLLAVKTIRCSDPASSLRKPCNQRQLSQQPVDATVHHHSGMLMDRTIRSDT